MTIHLTGYIDGEDAFFSPTPGIYPDNTPYVKGLPPAGMRVSQAIIQQINLQDFIASLWYVSQIGPIDTLVIPCFPMARQDRSNPTGDVLDSKYRVMRMLAQMLREGDIKDVLTFDIHSDKHNQMLGDKLINIDPALIIYNATCSGVVTNPTDGYYDMIIAPDAGARERAERVGAMFHTPVAVAEKHRNPENGYIESYSIDLGPQPGEPVKVLVIDDLCDGGKTFEILADSLPEQTEKHLFVTHGLFTNGTGQLLKRYDHIVTTNSAFGYRDGVQVINLFPGVLNDA